MIQEAIRKLKEQQSTAEPGDAELPTHPGGAGL